MSRFPFAPRSFFALALLLPAAAAAQPAPGTGAGTPPVAPAAPAAPACASSRDNAASRCWACTCACAARTRSRLPPARPSIADRSSLLRLPREPPAPAPAPTTDRTTDVSIGANPKDVYAEDWWVHSRPIFEMHGYLRVRAELFHGFALGRLDNPNVALWPQPADNSYTDLSGDAAPGHLSAATRHIAPCDDKTQAGANMRFRINPELHISDNLRILSQIDMLDNLVLGSTPGGFANQPAADDGGYTPTPGSPYVPLGSLATTTAPPTTGINSFPQQHPGQASVGRVCDAARPAPVRPHAQPLGSRHLREQRRYATTRIGSRPRPHHVHDRHQEPRSLFLRHLGFPERGSDQRNGREPHRWPALRSGPARRRQPVHRDDRAPAQPGDDQARSGPRRRGLQRRRVLSATGISTSLDRRRARRHSTYPRQHRKPGGPTCSTSGSPPRPQAVRPRPLAAVPLQEVPLRGRGCDDCRIAR